MSVSGAADTLLKMFSQGKAYGNIKYYYIQTDKQNDTPYKDTSANANAVGGQLGFETASLTGWELKTTFMFTNGFLLDDPVDTSILSRDNGIHLGTGAGSKDAQESFAVLGEALISYSVENFSINYGRQVIKTPLIHAKEVRMLPSSVQGVIISYRIDTAKLDISGGYLTHFKQRTSDQFINIQKHALGEKMREITGHEEGELIYGSLKWYQEGLDIALFDCYAPDFLNSLHGNVSYKSHYMVHPYTLSLELLWQRSVGNADTNLQKVGSAAGGKKIDAKAISFKGSISMGESNFLAAYSYIADKNSAHDSLVLPWDGTPLYTNMITSNDLFASNYGKGLSADSIYIGGTQAFKVAYTQTYDFTGYKGFKSVLSYMNADNDKFTKGNQQDLNIVLAYKYDSHLSLALKGIFVVNNTNASADGTIEQLDDFQQYRVIANYTF